MANILSNKLTPNPFPGSGSAKVWKVINACSDYGCIGDGVTDNTTALLNMQAELLAQQNPTGPATGFKIVFDGVFNGQPSHYLFQNNRMFWGLRWLDVDWNGSYWQNVANIPGSNDLMTPGSSNRPYNSLQPILPYISQHGPTTQNSSLINLASGGAVSITLKTPSEISGFFKGAWLVVFSLDQEYSNQPPNCANVDYVRALPDNITTGTTTIVNSSTITVTNRYAFNYGMGAAPGMPITIAGGNGGADFTTTISSIPAFPSQVITLVSPCPTIVTNAVVTIQSFDSTNGIIWIDRPLTCLHSDTYPDSNNSEAPAGPARAICVDRPDLPFQEYVRYSNVNALPNPNISSATSRYPYGSQVFGIVNCYRGIEDNVSGPIGLLGGVSQCHDFTIRHSTVYNVEIDKLVVNYTAENCTVWGGGDGAIKSIVCVNCNILGPTSWSAKTVHIIGGTMAGPCDSMFNPTANFRACISANQMNTPTNWLLEGVNFKGRGVATDLVLSTQNPRPLTIDGAAVTLTNNYTLSFDIVTTVANQRWLSAINLGSIVTVDANPLDGVNRFGEVTKIYATTLGTALVDIRFNAIISTGMILQAYPMQSFKTVNCTYENFVYMAHGANNVTGSSPPYTWVPRMDWENNVSMGVDANRYMFYVDTYLGQNLLINVKGNLTKITINVISSYTGGDAGAKMIVSNFGVGSQTLSQTVDLTVAGVRTVTSTGVTGSVGADSLAALTGQYMTQVEFIHANTAGGNNVQLGGAQQTQAHYQVIIETLPNFRNFLQ